MAAVDELIIEVAPDELERVGNCSPEQIVSAMLLLLVSEAPDPIWEEQWAVLQVVAAHKLVPSAAERRRKGLATLKAALDLLPWNVRQEATVELRKGIAECKEGI
jgi:hypothetical protein